MKKRQFLYLVVFLAVSAWFVTHFGLVGAASRPPAERHRRKPNFRPALHPVRAIKPAPALADAPARELLLGILTDPSSLRSVGMAVYTTWARECESIATVVFFIGSCTSEVAGFPGRIVCLDTPDVYPPQRKVFLMWKYMFEHFVDSHRLFMKVDHDSYVCAPGLSGLIAALLKQGDAVPVYTGLPATGRKEEQRALGLDGKPYCSGLGYIMNRVVLTGIAPHLLTCLDGVVSNHSDTEMGRCVFAYGGTECVETPGFPFRQIYYQQDESMVYPMTLVNGGQMKLKFMRAPKAVHFGAVALHPLKRAEDFYRFHKQTMARLRPVQPPISKKSFTVSMRQATNDLKTTCVNNPARQSELYDLALPECAPPPSEASLALLLCIMLVLIFQRGP
jgi:hypothetical protein